jgi:hypothetical protein
MNWNMWIKGWQLGRDAQRVIAMVSEKLAAGAAAQAAALAALLNGNGVEAAASRALIPIQRTLRANRRRLGRAG